MGAFHVFNLYKWYQIVQPISFLFLINELWELLRIALENSYLEISWKASVHQRVVTKFRLKMTLLNFWIELTQKGYFRTKKMKINIELYIFKLI